MLQGYYMERHAQEHMNECMRTAATERELKASGLLRQSGLQLIISREAARLGGILVSLGRRLERSAAPRATYSMTH